jgi:hypothetical protein
MPIKLDADIDGSHPLVPIVLREIKKMTDKYRLTMHAGDTKSLWVSKAEFDALITDNPGANGIRLYYGRHAPDDTADFKNKHNMILVATKGPNVVGAPLSSENSVDQLNDAIANGPVNSVIVGFSGMGGDAIPLCPPHCPIPASVLS